MKSYPSKSYKEYYLLAAKKNKAVMKQTKEVAPKVDYSNLNSIHSFGWVHTETNNTLKVSDIFIKYVQYLQVTSHSSVECSYKTHLHIEILLWNFNLWLYWKGKIWILLKWFS